MSSFDPDLDMLPPRLESPSGAPAREFQRLIVNPLIAMIALLGVWALFRYSLQIRNLPLFLLSLGLVVVCPLLVQFHCVDCGRVDFTIRAKRHACVDVIRRMRLDEDPPFPALSIRFQVTMWVVAIVGAWLMYEIMARGFS